MFFSSIENKIKLQGWSWYKFQYFAYKKLLHILFSQITKKFKK